MGPRASRLGVIAVVLAATACGAEKREPESVGTAVEAIAIPGLFSTGVDNNRNGLPIGTTDPHYALASGSALVVDPASAWGVPNAPTSRWISPAADRNGPRAIFRYRLTFSLTDVDLTTASINGLWACDDTCIVRLNGVQVASNTTSRAWSTLVAFTVPAGSPFRLGANTLDFEVNNSGGGDTGLHVAQIAGTVQLEANGAPCSDGSVCASGFCANGVCCNASCQQACHACSVAAGAATDGLCAPTSGGACDDGNACTQNDTCQNGACVGGPAITCPAPTDSCHATSTCNPMTGMCSNSVVPDGTPCNDGNACTQNDVCKSGMCVGGSAIVCRSDACHSAACDPTTGMCSSAPLRDGTPCDDGNRCTAPDTCQAGICTGAPVVCPTDACHYPVTCDPATGMCPQIALNDGTPCDDGNKCTTNDACQKGACTGEAVVCQTPDECHNFGICDPATGMCTNAYADGTPCDDADPCTQKDTCQGGKCTGASPVVCTALDACHLAGTCDPKTGKCSDPAAPDGALCDDGDACTQVDLCKGGRCEGHLPVECAPPPDACHGAGVCNPDGGTCSYPTLVDGAVCQKDLLGGGCACEVGRERSDGAAWLALLVLGACTRARRAKREEG